MSQTAYNRDFAVAQAGMIADLGFSDRIESASAESAVPFGKVVVAGTNPETQVKVAAADTDTVAGIAVLTHLEQTSAGVAQYADKETVNVARKAVVWCPATDPVTINTAVYADLVTVTGNVTGASASNLEIPTAVFRSSKDATTGLAKVEVNLP